MIDHNDHWVGGSDILVQVGDFLDRGDDEPEIMDLLQQLSVEAQQASGGLYALLGNHETMNVQLDFRYVTTDGFADYADTPYQTSDTVVMDFPQQQRGRAAAFKPGGVEALRLSGQKVALQIGDTVFVHGGLLPDHALYGLDNLNDDVSAWMQGQRSEPVDLVGGDGPLWVRHYSSAPDQDDCALLQQTLSLLGARRMVVGHTVVSGITSACGQQVWLVDVGLSSYYGGGISVLELTGSAAQVLRL